MKHIIAIDPGKSGGLAVSLEAGSVFASPCPETDRDRFELLEDVMSWVADREVLCVIEKVHAMPGQGVTSMFTFGMGYGGWLMALTALKIPFIEVTPQAWMKKFGALPKEKKERKLAIKDRMQKKYPHIKVTLNVADALAIMDVYKEE